jgi:hypothetical protein
MVVILITVIFFVAGCDFSSRTNSAKGTRNPTGAVKDSDNSKNQITPNPTTTTAKIDYSKVKPDESGKIMVVMFHNFVKTFKLSAYDDGQYTTTFDEFRSLLQTLYDKDYRLINFNDYLNNNITVPAGYIPMVFTFDDGTIGQFNLIEENGELAVNKNSAVGIMQEFNETHPDFGLKGTFYVNLGGGTFEGKGTLAERLKFLIDMGFEIGNHTLNHIDLKQVTTAGKVLEEIGGNQKRMNELVPGYKMNTLSLPLGNTTRENLRKYIEKGDYKGAKYENAAIVMVGWDPALSPVSKDFNPLLTHRVRATGIKAVDMDLSWWLRLKNLSRKTQYVSDGDPDTITVPKSNASYIDKSKLKGKKLVKY